MNRKIINRKSIFLTGLLVLVMGGVVGWKKEKISLPKPNSQRAEKLEEASVLYWTCVMHPQVHRGHGGKCPICGMALVPVKKEVGDLTLHVSKPSQALANVQTTRVATQPAAQVLNVLGKIAVNDTQTKTISARISGRIDKLYINYTGQVVHRLDPVALMYSPEMEVAKKEWLISMGTPLEPIAREKLRLLGVTHRQMHEIRWLKNQPATTMVYAAESGVVTDKLVSQGQYVNVGTPLFTLTNVEKLWLILDVYEADVAKIKMGQMVRFKLNAYPNDSFSGVVSFIQPMLDANTRTASVRIDVANASGKLKPGMLATAEITGASMPSSPLMIPATAPLIAGDRAVVYVQTSPTTYEERDVELGNRVGDFYVVKKGLAFGEHVVTKGNFYIDSAMQLQGKPSMMNVGKPQPTSSPHVHQSNSVKEPTE